MPVTRNQSNIANSTKPSSSNAENANKESTEKEENNLETESHRRDSQSPDNCSICLGPFNNKSFTSSCAHSFCFVCLKQWSKVKAECPLCKQAFTSIFHNIRSDQSYDIYEIPISLQPVRQNAFELFFPSGLTTFSAPYLSLTQPSLDADLTLSNFSRFQFRHRRYDRYLQHPVHNEHQYSFLFNPSAHVSAVSWPRGFEDFRRSVYKHNLGPPLIILGNETSTYRLTPAMVAASAHRIQRIMPWLTRELKVLLKSHQNVRLAISIIQPLLSQVLIDSIHFSEKVSPLIGRRARQFIQEFVAFANSALTMQAFDRKAIYFRPNTPSTIDDSSSSSSGEDDVVEITDVSSDPEITGRTSPVRPLAGGSGLFRAGWDSPTPGPSWENPLASMASSSVNIETVSVSSESDDPVFIPGLIESDSSSQAGSDIVFLKYDKPWTERSPIQLSSDSDGTKKKRRKKSKHRKKKRELLGFKDNIIARNKPEEALKQKNSSDDEALICPEQNFALRKKRMHSSSSEKQKRKKKKKAKDRELVDRLFAQAVSQGLNTNRTSDSSDQETPTSSIQLKEILGISNSDKGKRKHKKKSRTRSGDSQSSSNIHPYKKHHTGHKRSGDKNPGAESERSKHKTKQTSPGNSIPNCLHEGESTRWNDSQLLRSQPLPSPAIVGHSNFHQPNYLAVPDTLQHIPLNLWVSAWPAIPTSHTFTSIPSSSTFLTSSLPLSTSAPVDSHALLSDSSSLTDSDDTEKYSMPSVSSRTKQWLNDNFPHQENITVTKAIHSSKASCGKAAPSWNLNSLNEVNSQQTGADFSKNIVSVSDDDEHAGSSGNSKRPELMKTNDPKDSSGVSVPAAEPSSAQDPHSFPSYHSVLQPLCEEEPRTVPDSSTTAVTEDNSLRFESDSLRRDVNMNRRLTENSASSQDNRSWAESMAQQSSVPVMYNGNAASSSTTVSSLLCESNNAPLNLTYSMPSQHNTSVFPPLFQPFSQLTSPSLLRNEATGSFTDPSKKKRVSSFAVEGLLNDDNFVSKNSNEILLNSSNEMLLLQDNHIQTDTAGMVPGDERLDQDSKTSSDYLENDNSVLCEMTECTELNKS